jgi:predicted MFS family arabinose efflux permease
MCGQVQSNTWQTVANAVTALSCAALLWTSHTLPAGHKPQPGTRTAVELIANTPERILLKAALLRVT